MSTPAELAKVAFALHEEGRIERRELVRMLQTCCNIAALENGYADEHGLPFPRRRSRRPRRSRRAP